MSIEIRPCASCGSWCWIAADGGTVIAATDGYADEDAARTAAGIWASARN